MSNKEKKVEDIEKVSGTDAEKKVEDNQEKIDRAERRRLIKNQRKIQKQAKAEQHRLDAQMRKKVTAAEFYQALSNHQNAMRKILDGLYTKTDTLVISFHTLRDIVLKKHNMTLEEYTEQYKKNLDELKVVQETITKFTKVEDQISELLKLNINPDSYGVKLEPKVDEKIEEDK